MTTPMICGELLTIEEAGATFTCDLAPDHERGDEGMHSCTAQTEDPIPIEYNVLWGVVDYDTR